MNEYSDIKNDTSNIQLNSNRSSTKLISVDNNKNNDNDKEKEVSRRHSTRQRRSRIPEQTMKQFLEITGKYNINNISKSNSNILNKLYEQEQIINDDIINDVVLENDTKINENIGNNNNINKNSNVIEENKNSNKKNNNNKKLKKHDQKTISDYINIPRQVLIDSKQDGDKFEKKIKADEPHQRRSNRKRHPIIPDNTLKSYLEITGEFDKSFNQQQSQILEQLDEQISLSTYLTENNGINYNEKNKKNKLLNESSKMEKDNMVNSNLITDKSSLNSSIDESINNLNRENSSVETSTSHEKLKRESGSDSEMEFHQRRSKRVRHLVINEDTLKEYLELTSGLDVKHRSRRGKNKKRDGGELTSGDSLDPEQYEKEKEKLRLRRQHEKRIQERFYNYDFGTGTVQEDLYNSYDNDKYENHSINEQNSLSGDPLKKKNSISDYYKVESEKDNDKNDVLRMEEKINKEYKNVKIDSSNNEVSVRVKNRIKSLKKKISKKDEKHEKHATNSIDSMLMKNSDKSDNLGKLKNNEEKPEKIFPIFNKSRRKVSESTTTSENDTNLVDATTEESKEKTAPGINEAQPLSIIETDSFFLTSKQKQLKMQKLNQQKLRKDLEESYKFHSSFAQGKAIHTFFQLATSRQNSATSQTSADSSANPSFSFKSYSDNIEYPAVLMEAAYPTSWNAHVINGHNYKDTIITESSKFVNEPSEKLDDMNIYLSPTKTSSTIEIESNGNANGPNDSQNTEIIHDDNSSYIDVDDESDKIIDDSSINSDNDMDNSSESNSFVDTQETQIPILENDEQTSTGMNALEHHQDVELLMSMPSSSPNYDNNFVYDSDVSMSDESEDISDKSDDTVTPTNSFIIYNHYKFYKRHPTFFNNFDFSEINDFLVEIINNKNMMESKVFDRMNRISKCKINNSNDVFLKSQKDISQVNFNQFLSILFPSCETSTSCKHFREFACENKLLEKYSTLFLSKKDILEDDYPKFEKSKDSIWTEKYSPNNSEKVLSNKPQAKEIINWLNKWKIGKTELPTSPKEEENTDGPSKRGRKKQNVDTAYHPEDDVFMGYYDYNLFFSSVEENKDDRFLFLVGPPASGKSSTIQACALECGFEILEIYPGIKRSGKDIANIIGDLTQSHMVMSMDKSLHSPKQKISASFPSPEPLIR